MKFKIRIDGLNAWVVRGHIADMKYIQGGLSDYTTEFWDYTKEFSDVSSFNKEFDYLIKNNVSFDVAVRM